MTVSSKPQEEDADGDVGLQLKVSFMDKAVQRNARMAGKWGPAEKTLSYFPFAPGEAFKVYLLKPKNQKTTMKASWEVVEEVFRSWSSLQAIISHRENTPVEINNVTYELWNTLVVSL